MVNTMDIDVIDVLIHFKRTRETRYGYPNHCCLEAETGELSVRLVLVSLAS